MSVVVYTTPGCPWCKKAKDFLNENKISFEEKDASVPENAKEAIEKSGQRGVPVIEINGKIVVGFDETKLKTALKI